MAPPTPGRHRGPRPQVNNNIGEAGRTTNVVPPKRVARDSAGHERADDFFDRAANGEDEDDDMYDEPAYAATVKQSAKKKVVVNGHHGREQRGERPDRYMLGEDRGRKTGVVKALSQRDAEGFEDMDKFFQSPSPSRSTVTAFSTVKSRKNGQLFNPPSIEDDEEYDQDESDMMVDDGTSLSPLTYQRLHASSARRPSTLRQSTVPGSHRKNLATSSPNSPRRRSAVPPRRRLSSLSGSGDDADAHEIEDLRLGSSDDEAEEEVIQATLVARNGAGGSAKKVDKGKGKASVIASDEDDEPEDNFAFEDDEEEDEAPSRSRKSTAATSKKKAARVSNASTTSRRTSGGSPDMSGLVKLDRNGRPVAADRKGKGKAVARSPSPPQGDHHEEDFGGGFDDEDDAQGGDYGDGVDEEGFPQYDAEDFEEQEDPDAPGPSSRPAKGASKKKAAAPAKPKTSKKKAPARDEASDSQSPPPRKVGSSKKRVLEPRQERVVEDMSRKRQRENGTVDIDGVRRSTRQRIEPLEYWRNERVIYKRRASSLEAFSMNAIVRVPKVDPEPLTKAGKKKASHVKRGDSHKPASRVRSVKPEAPEEEGCDDMTDPDGIVWSWEGDAETSRRIAFTQKMMDPKATFDGQFSFQKIYQELDYLAGGIMVIPPDGAKGNKPAKDNSYIFYCIQGSVSVSIHRTRFTIGPGGTFFVPRGNAYSIKATSEREVRLFFAQGRRVFEDSNGNTRPDTLEDARRFVAQEQLDAVPEEPDEEDEE
ncbi:hypothetical protein JCM10207_004074 [Rhodosporidiobolus poonsookiae]